MYDSLFLSFFISLSQSYSLFFDDLINLKFLLDSHDSEYGCQALVSLHYILEALVNKTSPIQDLVTILQCISFYNEFLEL